MATPVPKPRTKFATDSGMDGSSLTISNQISPSPSACSTSSSPKPLEIPASPSPPAVPPRPPSKPPRMPGNHATVPTFGNVLGELKVNLGETPKPPEIGLILAPSEPMSPPNRCAPPPPPGWKPELGQKPLVPERNSSAHNSNRPLPAIPAEISPLQSGPSTSSSSNGPLIIENPIYLTLDNYRSISGITPSPSQPPTTSPDCDELREWLTEDEEETENQTQTHPDDSSHDENPYTPCPRRSDYSQISNPFDDVFFNQTTATTSSRSSRKSINENVYVAPHFETHNSYENVVEACAPEELPKTSPLPTHYVNVGETSRRNSGISRLTTPDNDFASFYDSKTSEGGGGESGKMKIDGSMIAFVGFVCLTSSKKEKRLHCRLRNMQLSFHEDEETNEPTNGPFDIKDIYLFRQVQSTKSADNPGPSSSSSDTPLSFSALLLHVGEKRHVVSFTPEDPASLWMFFISEAWLSLHCDLTTVLRDADELIICGNVWIKHGATGEWRLCSVGVNGMTLYYVYADARERILKRNSKLAGEELVDVDLRKVMTMRDRIDKTEFCPHVKHKRGPFSITLHGITLYIDSRDDSTTSNWYEAIDSLLKRPANRLEYLRLTGDNIPVIVDKCIRFVSTYGMNSEGIYRRNGKVTEAKLILTKLTEDPVGFHPVKETDETVYAVADVLRQFFRKLDEPLFPASCQAELFDLALESQSESLWNRYAELIEQLPTIHHSTLKKLIGHLKNVAEHATENRASVENLAKIFGASLFATDSMMSKHAFSESINHQINTMIHLIMGYDVIFQISMKEETSRQRVADYEKKPLNTKKPSPDFIVPIHVWEKENRPFNVSMLLASEEVIREAVAKRGFDGPLESPYAIFECLAGGNLIRRLPNSQKISKIVLQWLDWNCKDGFFLFNHDKYRFNSSEMSCFTGKVKVAEPGSKTFKSYEVKIENGTSIVAFRNEKPWKSWPLDDVIWYIGTDSARKAPNEWNCTMLSQAKDGYAPKLPGYTFSFKEESERSRWMTALSQYSKSDNTEPLVYIN